MSTYPFEITSESWATLDFASPFFWGEIAAYILLGVYLYIIPGAALLAWALPELSVSWSERLGIAAALSLSLYPLLALWFYWLGIVPGQWLAWLPGGVALLFLLWRFGVRMLGRRQAAHTPSLSALWSRLRPGTANTPTYFLLLLLALLLFIRFAQIHDMTAPAWGDSVHHTLIVQLILDHGGLFQNWEPYAPMTSFTYHFGFHVTTAMMAYLAGLTALEAVLIVGQILNVLAVVALIPLAVRMGGSRMAGVGALLIAGLLSTMPAFYMNWGRYTQLAAQIILPGFLWVIDSWWREKPAHSGRVPAYGYGWLCCLLLAGLALTHYRVAILAVLAAVAWAVWALWLYRREVGRWLSRTLWLAAAGLLAAVLVLPWGILVYQGRLSYVVGAVASRATDSPMMMADLMVWQTINDYYPTWLWVGALLLMVLAFWKRPALAVPLVLWMGLCFVAANPFLFGLNGTGIVTNFLLMIAIYMPAAWVGGWAAGSLWETAMARLRTAPEEAVPARPDNRWQPVLSWVLFFLLLVVGWNQQGQIAQPFYRMVTEADETVLTWARRRLPDNSYILVNGFLTSGDSVVVGSDAGWWIPYFTRQHATVPPVLYSTEQLPETMDRNAFRQLILDLRASQSDTESLEEILCRNGITHVYLGQGQGQVGIGAEPIITDEMMAERPDFQLLFRRNEAEIWQFHRENCP